MAKRSGILSEFLGFVKANKAYWIAPIVVVVLLLAVVVIFGGGAMAPFIYTLF